MEFNCPDCGKRLRAPDHLKNPLVRCRTCGATFRPREEHDDLQPAVISTTAMPARPSPSAAEVPLKPWPAGAGSAAASTAAKGFGVIGFILLILLAKAPRLLKLFEREPPAPAPPQVREADLQAIQQMLQEAQQRPPFDPALVQPDEGPPRVLPPPARPSVDEAGDAAPNAAEVRSPDEIP